MPEVNSCILDAEVVAYDREQRCLLPFQVKKKLFPYSFIILCCANHHVVLILLFSCFIV